MNTTSHTHPKNSNLFNKIRWLARSNALLYTTSTRWRLPSGVDTNWVNSHKLLVVELPFTNPCCSFVACCKKYLYKFFGSVISNKVSYKCIWAVIRYVRSITAVEDRTYVCYWFIHLAEIRLHNNKRIYFLYSLLINRFISLRRFRALSA